MRCTWGNVATHYAQLVAAEFTDCRLYDWETAIDNAQKWLENRPKSNWPKAPRGVRRIKVDYHFDSDNSNNDDAGGISIRLFK